MFSFERKTNKQEKQPKLHIDGNYIEFIPKDFNDDPEKYIEERGINIKSGEIQYHEDGSIREDPSAAKILPEWQNSKGEIIEVISKKVNLEKVRTKTEPGGEKIEEPLLEYKMMSLCQILGLPSAKPVGFIKDIGNSYTLMEKIEGFSLPDKKSLFESGLVEEDGELIKLQIENLMDELKEKYEELGLYRKWKANDMIFDLDVENKKVLNITPIDWEKSHIYLDKLMSAISNYSIEKQEEIKRIISIGK